METRGEMEICGEVDVEIWRMEKWRKKNRPSDILGKFQISTIKDFWIDSTEFHKG